MNRTRLKNTYWKNDPLKARSYWNLSSNDEAAVVKWLYDHGFVFSRCWGTECHDIGDTDYFSGAADASDIDSILAFMDKLFGEWDIRATYHGVDVNISKIYPDITHFLSFRYPREQEDLMLHLFEGFEQKFCYPEIIQSEEYR